MKIHKYLDPILETAILLSYGLDADKIKDDYIEAIDKVGVNGKLFYEKYLSDYDGFLRSFMRNRIVKPDDINFSRDNAEYENFVLSLLMLERDLVKNIDQMSEEEVLRSIVVCYNESYETELYLPDTITTDALLVFTSETGFSESTKWQLITLLKDPKPYFKQLCKMIENNLGAYEKTCEENKEYIEQGLRFFTENVDKEDTMGDVDAIMPMASLPASLMAMKSICYYGIYWKAISKLIMPDEMDNEKLAESLKAISDKSRLEILSLLKHSSMYSLEIAEKLELTPATVSHHMSILIVLNLVTIEKRGGRIYYQLNNKTISVLIKQIENKLLCTT